MNSDTETAQEQTPERRIAVVCPKCARGYKVAPSLLGRRLVCKDCRHEWRARRVTVGEIRNSLTRKQDHSSELGSTSLNDESPPRAGTSVAIDMSWAGRKIGRYKARSLLGYGGMGVVWRAHDDSLRRDVALKILSHTRDQKKKTGLNLDLFMQEARAVAKLQHPSVVSIFEVGEDQGHVFLSLELMEGGTLKEYVDKTGKIEARRLFEWMTGPARALALAHRRGVIHRDIKPGNLMLDDHGHLKLMDFGLADVTNEEASEKLRGKAVGSLGWVAPETAKGKPTTAISDIYSMGLVMLYALTGKPLIHGKSRTEVIALHQNPPPLKLNEIKGLTAKGRALMEKCLAVEPEKRFQSAEALADALQACADEDPAENKRRRVSGVSIAVAATVIGVIAGIGLTLYYVLNLMNEQAELSRPSGPETIHVKPNPTPVAPRSPARGESATHPPNADRPAILEPLPDAPAQSSAAPERSPAAIAVESTLPKQAEVTDVNARLPWPEVISGEGLVFIASDRGRVFHVPDGECGARRIIFKSLVKFDTFEAALETGRSPCRQCLLESGSTPGSHSDSGGA